MPNKHAAIKDLRKNLKRADRNKRLKTHVKALSQRLQSAIKEGKKAEALEAAKKLQQIVAKAAKNHIVHANKASRKVSSAHRALATMK